MTPPGTQPPRRLRPRLHWELIACGLQGHEMIGIDAAALRPSDALVAREGADGVRWHRCVRCDSWLPLAPPAQPSRQFPPERDEIALPLRGRPLRDRFVLRLIAVDRAFHFLLLTFLGVAILLVASHETTLRDHFYRVVTDLQGSLGGPIHADKKGLVAEIQRLLSMKNSELRLIGVLVLAYGVLEGIEAVGLWLARRWAEYLTFLATTLLLPLEIYELAHRVTPLKIVAFVLNVAVVVYLLYAKRLFGLGGGGAAEEAARERDTGWEALERSFSAGAAPDAGGGVPAA
ncbi:MAG: hypothetical protein JWQ48_1080 [Conexibacter sp.]|nr:hypothetical protein [Conexibacter sp.]